MMKNCAKDKMGRGVERKGQTRRRGSARDEQRKRRSSPNATSENGEAQRTHQHRP